MPNVDDLRAAGCLHPEHEFTADETKRIESLNPDEVQAMISVRAKLGHDLCTKKDDEPGVFPDTMVI